MNGNQKTRTGRLAVAGVGLFLMMTLGGCSAWNDDPGSSPTLTINPAQLAADMGLFAGSSNPMALAQPVESATQSKVRTLIVGAVVIRSRTKEQGPYTKSTPISDVDDLTDDLANSSDNLTFFHFDDVGGIPDVVEIPVPPPGSEKWQIFAAGLNTHPNGILEMLDQANQDSINYVGFDDQFLKTAADGAITKIGTSVPVDTVNITMLRACLVANPPKGCAQYDGVGTMVLTDAVEVIGVSVVIKEGGSVRELNLQNYQSGAEPPIFVRAGLADGCLTAGAPFKCNADDAEGSFFNFIWSNNGVYPAGGNPFNSGDEVVKSITVRVTRQLAANASTACANATTVEGLRTACAVEEVTTTFE